MWQRTSIMLQRRCCSTLAKALPRGAKLCPMPRLSPTMTSGTLLKWRVEEGAMLPESGMEPLCDVQPTRLTDDPDDEIDGPPILEIESHEEGFLARILLKEGESAAPDVAIAVICESEEDVRACRDAVDLAKPSLVGDDAPVVEAGTFAWQAYLAAGHSARACSNS